MSELHAPHQIWQQLAADMTARLGRAVMTECQSWRILRRHLLQAQAEVLKGLLKVVESRLETKDRGNVSTSEKIPVD